MGRATDRSTRRVVVAVGVLVLVVGTSIAFALREWPVWTASRAAKRALAEGRYTDAGAAIERWVALRPDSAEAQYLRAKTAIALGVPRDIGDGLRRAQSLGYPADRLAVLRALLAAQQGRVAQARPFLEREFFEARTPDLMIDEALARVLLDMYDFPAATVVLTRWGEDAPNDPRPPLWMAGIHRRRLAEPEVILGDYHEALRRDPAQPEARLGLATELAKAHRNEEAAAAFDAYLLLRPDDPVGRLGAGRNALELGDLPAAARQLDRALELDPTSADAHADRAKLAQRQGDEALALVHLDQALARKPYDATLHYSRKLALTRLNRRDDAAAEQREIDRVKVELDRADALQTALVKTPHDAGLEYQLAVWMFSHGYPEEGLTWANKILSEHAGHPETCALLADYYERRGDLARALSYRGQSH
jgi:tetratricopeptide (TPR) repeat protein